MADTIKLPGIGPQKKQTVLLVGGGFVVLGVVLYVRRKRAAATSTSPATVDPSQIDPATGFPYGSPEDAQALAAQSAYIGGTNVGGGGGPIDSGTTVNPVATNPEWDQAATTYLTQGGAGFGAVSTALGKYLHGEGVDATEKSIVLQAIAAEGSPPQAGPGGYPPNIREITGPTKMLRLAFPHAKVDSHTRLKAEISWTAVPHAQGYHVHHLAHPSQTITGGVLKASVTRPGTYFVTAFAKGYYESNPSNFLHV